MTSKYIRENQTKNGMLFILFFIFLALAFAWLSPKIKHEGQVLVIDGDSLNVGGREIRIHGIDAPEFSQTCLRNEAIIRCGRDAMRHMAGLINGKNVICEEKDIDRYGRSVSRCFVDGEDIGAKMVLDGYAVSYGNYLQEEAEARSAKRGIWAMNFIRPDEFRRQKRLNSQQ